MIANIASDDALILPHRANLAGSNFRERQCIRADHQGSNPPLGERREGCLQITLGTRVLNSNLKCGPRIGFGAARAAACQLQPELLAYIARALGQETATPTPR
jgi:hypothetical protein